METMGVVFRSPPAFQNGHNKSVELHRRNSLWWLASQTQASSHTMQNPNQIEKHKSATFVSTLSADCADSPLFVGRLRALIVLPIRDAHCRLPSFASCEVVLAALVPFC